MLYYSEILIKSPYSMEKAEKEKLLTERLLQLTEYHYQKCELYRNMLDCFHYSTNPASHYLDIPFFPVSLFKELDLISVRKEEIFKTMTSSGTTGQRVSKIYLDRNTAANQQKTLVRIVSDFTGSSRLPMLIIDSPSVIKDRKMFSARGAGILGFSIMGTDRTYALKDDMTLDLEAIQSFLEKYKNQKILLFGFTFMIWEHLYQELRRQGVTMDFSQGILIHGGGWKKLVNQAVDSQEFKKCLFQSLGLQHIHDYYGMVEQTGCISMECDYGHLHTSTYSDVIPRRPIDFTPCNIGEKGILQVVSLLPESYPGHSLLTEDEGVVLGEDDCPCGRKGKYFKVLGRLKNAEIRGCSDTYELKF